MTEVLAAEIGFRRTCAYVHDLASMRPQPAIGEYMTNHPNRNWRQRIYQRKLEQSDGLASTPQQDAP